MPSPHEIAMLVLIVALVPLACVWYFVSADVHRPPLGTFNAKDVGLIMIAVVMFPLLYLVLPVGVVATVFALTFLGIVHMTLAALLPRVSAGMLSAAVVAAPLILYWMVGGGATSLITLAASDLVVAIAIVGICNLYVQNAFRASDVVIFVLALAVYDVLATTVTGLTGRLFDRLGTLPLIPGLFWGTGPNGAGVGMGDILVLSLWALVVYKGWGFRAFWWAAALAPGFVTTIAILQLHELLPPTVPVMTAVAPVVVLQYFLFRKTWGKEATVRARRLGPQQSERSSVERFDATLSWLLFKGREGTQSVYAGSYVALADRAVVGAGGSALDAVAAARRAGVAEVEACVYIPAADRSTTGQVVLASGSPAKSLD